MTCWSECVYFVCLRVVGNSMCSRLRLHRLTELHCVGVEDRDHPRLSDSHVEMVEMGIKNITSGGPLKSETRDTLPDCKSTVNRPPWSQAQKSLRFSESMSSPWGPVAGIS